MRDIERYLNIRSAYGGSLSPSGTLAFLMDTTGVPQVWTLSEPEAWPEQRTFYDEAVSFVSCSPTREEAVFGMDEGGDERMQLYLLDLDPDPTADPIAGLTLPSDPSSNESRPNDARAKHRWGGWSHDGDRFAFASNRRDEAAFDVYVQGRDERGDGADLVHEGDGWLTVEGFSPDDSALIVTEAYSSFDQDVYALDLPSGDFTHLTPHEGTVRFLSATWAPDGEGIYVVTDRDSDLLYLARLDLDGTLTPVVEDDEWNVDGVALDHDTGRAVYSRNVDGYTELTVGDLDGAVFRGGRTLDLPPGVAGGVSFDEGARSFSLTVTGSAENANVHVVDVASGERERWTRASTAGVPRESFVEPELVRYESFDGREIPAFFSVPRAANERDGAVGDGVPVVVDVHGGPESQRRPSFYALKQYFLRRSYAVFEPNVRGSTGYGTAYTHLDDVERRMDSVADVRAGVEWLSGQPVVDPDRIVAFGGSYGGFMVLAALTEYPDLWAAGVDVVGIANFVTFLENTGSWRRELREAEYGSLEDDREFLESISPVNTVDAIRAPLFVLHGANDPRVPVGEAEQIAEAAREQGVPVETLIFEDEGHGVSKLENRIEAYSRIVTFLDEHV
ncbi:S9 family peptidase [Halomarina pelagica]|uniref:S9 family peptidase n=1 Tax=Halomarina pelagica TaxID=2961599 RepID=UPI0020C4B505|nr:S9 family peptidase [Halomarina sp. BND7]